MHPGKAFGTNLSFIKLNFPLFSKKAIISSAVMSGDEQLKNLVSSPNLLNISLINDSFVKIFSDVAIICITSRPCINFINFFLLFASRLLIIKFNLLYQSYFCHYNLLAIASATFIPSRAELIIPPE